MRDGGFPLYFLRMYSSVLTMDGQQTGSRWIKSADILYGWGSAAWGTARSPTILPDRRPTLLFLWPRPSNCTGVSRRVRLADRAPEALVATALPAAEVGGCFAPDVPLLADIDGEGEELAALMPFVCIPGGIGRLTLPGTVLAAVAEGAIFGALTGTDRRSHVNTSKSRWFPTLSATSVWFVHLMRLQEVKRWARMTVRSKQD